MIEYVWLDLKTGELFVNYISPDSPLINNKLFQMSDCECLGELED